MAPKIEWVLPDPPNISRSLLRDFEDEAEQRRRHLELLRKRVVEQREAGLIAKPRKCPTCDFLQRETPREGCLEHHPFIDWTPNLWQPRIWYSPAQFTAGSIGNRGGKSTGTTALATMRTTNLVPLWFLQPERVRWMPMLPFLTEKGPWHTVVVAPKRSTLELSVVKNLKLYLEGLGLSLGPTVETVGPGGKRYTQEVPLITGTIAFKVQDQTIDEFMGFEADTVFEDEELKGDTGEAVRSELRARLTDRGGRYYYTATAVNTAMLGGETWIAQKVFRPAKLGKLDPRDYFATTASTDENIHLSEAKREQHRRQFLDPITGEKTDWYRIRVDGEVIGVNVSAVLDPSSIAWQINNSVELPIAQGHLSGGDWGLKGGWSTMPLWHEKPKTLEPMHVRFSPAEHGPLKIWEFPQPGRPYVIGADAGSGKHAGCNPSAAWVMDRLTGRFVASLHGLITPVELGPWLVMLGWWYNHAYLNPEDAGPGEATVSWLMGADVGTPRYDRFYLHQRAGGANRASYRRPGYPANESARTFMLATLNDALMPQEAGNPESIQIAIPDLGTLEEMAAVKRDDKTGKIVYLEQDEGDMKLHGDRMVAAALCIVAHHSAYCPMEIPKITRVPFADPLRERAARDLERMEEEAEQTADGVIPLLEGVDFVADQAGARFDGWE